MLRLLFLFPLPILAAGLPAAETWPRFRGENGAGVSSTQGIPYQWTVKDYRWSRQLPGVGHSSPVAWEKQLYVTSGDETTGNRLILAVDADKGTTLWQRSFRDEAHGKHKLNSFASTTPAVDKDGIYLGWGTPTGVTIMALGHDGESRWKADLGAFKSGHGFGVSLVLHGDLVIIPNEHEGASALFALDKKDGAIRWKIDRDSRVTYSTPCLLDNGGRTELIFTNYNHGITAHDPGTGKLLWQADVFDRSHIESSIASPVIAGQLVLATSGWLGHGNEVIAVRPPRPGEGNRATQVYRIARGAPLCTTPLVTKGLLVLWSDNGIATAADAQSGKVHWQKRIGGTFYCSPICIGDAIYNIDTAGNVTALRAATEFKVLGRCALGDACHSTPAVAHDRLYLRTFHRLSALDRKP
ncbi:MAG: PQQ-binding-like beta-propeller repeat protein [Planctomycetota bacterium]|nr:PQQ-binding-like beta-propeller repeat protein [Planctomycetota bacterium]